MRIGVFLINVEEFKNDIVDIMSVGASRVTVVFKNYNVANTLDNHEVINKNSLVAYI